MELKLILRCPVFHAVVLLIVPYGIETYFGGVRYRKERLLIVPYGIETTPATPRTNGTMNF